MSVFFGVITAIMMLALVLLLLRPAEESRLSVWLLSALLPVLVAVTAALTGQSAAARTLADFDNQVQNRQISWQGADGSNQVATVALSGLDAACVVHAAGRGGKYHMNDSEMFVPHGAVLSGAWPTPEQVKALMISGELHCRHIGADTAQ